MTRTVESFAEEVKSCIEAKLSERETEYTVSLHEKTKNNDIRLHGIAIRPEGLRAVPLIYLENYFERYLDGMSADEIADRVIRLSERILKDSPEIKMPELDFESIRDRLRVKLVNSHTNADSLSSMVHRDVGCGFALTPYIDLPESSGISGIIQITKELARAGDYDERLLMDTALDNTAAMDAPYLKKITDMERATEGEDLFKTGGSCRSGVLVLGHESVEYGAVALFYPGMRQKISEIVGGDYYVLPSSVHELLILPDNGEYSSAELMEKVIDVNRNVLSPEERLADSVLLYRSDLALLTVAEELVKDNIRGLER